MPLYRINVIGFYNNNMGNLDLAYQLRKFIATILNGTEIESGGGQSGGGNSRSY